MSQSPARDLCWLFKGLWEAHALNHGRTYYITGRDMKEAKEFLAGNFGEFPPEDECKQRLARFMQTSFDGWKEQDYPLWALLKHWGRYASPRIVEKRWNGLRQCDKCGEIHYYGECKISPIKKEAG